MFKQLLIFTIMGTITIGATAQKERKYKELKQTKTGPIMQANAVDVWEIVGPGFADAYKWSTAIDHSEGSGEALFEGATCSDRACDLNAKGFNNISETLVEYSNNNKSLKYEVKAGLPGFVTYGSNRWRIVEVGPNQSQLEMTITMHLKPVMGILMGGMFKKNLNNTIDTVVRDLKVYAETGEISNEKKERMAKLAMAN